MTSAAPLADRVVLSVGHTLPGLYCLAVLRDLGAEVVRVERAAVRGAAGQYAGLPTPFPIRSLTAGTSAVGLDLKSDAGAAAFRRLARRADAVVEGFRPGVAARLGIDYERLRGDGHPALVYASISGFGQEGPARERVGHDLNYLAETGALGLANPTGLAGTTFADGLAGLGGALNVVAALHAASRTGEGQRIDLAIVDAPLFLMATELEHFWNTGESRGPGATHLTGRYPWYGVHATRDGGRVAVGAVEPAFYAALCRGIGHPELAERQFAAGEESEAARGAFEAAFSGRTRDEALALFDGADACASPVLSVAEVARSQLMERATRAGSRPGERLVRSPVRVCAAPAADERSGAQTLAHFGFTPAEIEALRDADALGEEK